MKAYLQHLPRRQNPRLATWDYLVLEFFESNLRAALTYADSKREKNEATDGWPGFIEIVQAHPRKLIRVATAEQLQALDDLELAARSWVADYGTTCSDDSNIDDVKAESLSCDAFNARVHALRVLLGGAQ